MHLAAVLSQLQAHDEFEDTDIINYLLDFQGDLNIQTRLVSCSFLSAVHGLIAEKDIQ